MSERLNEEIGEIAEFLKSEDYAVEINKRYQTAIGGAHAIIAHGDLIADESARSSFLAEAANVRQSYLVEAEIMRLALLDGGWIVCVDGPPRRAEHAVR